jgi:tetratricopeptide (TPR) repeat protein
MALISLGLMHANHIGDLAAAAALGEESVAIMRELGDQLELALALHCRGVVCLYWPRPSTDDFARGSVYLAEAQTLYEEVGSKDKDNIAHAGVAFTHMYRGVALLAAGDLRNAEMQLIRGLELTTASGDRFHAGVALTALSQLAWVRGDPAGARAHLEDALTQHEALQNQYNIGDVHTRLGDLLRRTGDPSAARVHYAHALRTLHAIGHGLPSHQALHGLAGLAMEAGEPACALRMVSGAGALAAETGVLPSLQVRTSIEQVEAAVRQALSLEAQAAAWAAGQAMAMEEVIAEALAQAEPEAE